MSEERADLMLRAISAQDEHDHKFYEVIARRFRIERDLRGGIERIYVEVSGRRKGERRWRLVWTLKQVLRGSHYDIRDVLQIGFVPALETAASGSDGVIGGSTPRRRRSRARRP